MTLYVVFRTYSSDSSSFLLTLPCPALSALSFVSILEHFHIYRLVNYGFFSLSMAHVSSAYFRPRSNLYF